jgi:UDP-2-acetamido-2,6-beta-L-arabino-hexul-4-ose reductase
MLKVGITGSNGFIGSHLLNTLKLYPADFESVGFERSYFDSKIELDKFVSYCDVIVHLAALNRHNDQYIIYKTNTDLINKLIESLKRTNSKPHIIFSSSIQEDLNNTYGQSKKFGRSMLEEWSRENGCIYTGMIIPNVFGPFGKPFYNSVVSTFSYQLANNETPIIQVDNEIRLIYVAELVSEIIKIIKTNSNEPTYKVQYTSQIKVSELLEKIKEFKQEYLDSGEIPILKNSFELNLFNTFRSYINQANHFPVKYAKNIDQRGLFVELVKTKIGGQFSFSTTLPGVTRGNHFHTRKIERFSVIKGKALIKIRKIDENESIEYYLNGNEPAFVDMPIWYTHNIKNIGDEELLTNFWINEPYDQNNPDTYFEEV